MKRPAARLREAEAEHLRLPGMPMAPSAKPGQPKRNAKTPSGRIGKTNVGGTVEAAFGDAAGEPELVEVKSPDGRTARYQLSGLAAHNLMLVDFIEEFSPQLSVAISQYIKQDVTVHRVTPDPPDLSETNLSEARRLYAKARELGFTVESAIETLEREAKKAAREATVRAKEQPRLKWDKDRLPDENPAAFAWRAYQAEAKARTLHRGLIGQEDKLLRRDLNNWLRTHAMPDGIDIPTLPEWNTRRLAEAENAPRPVRVMTEEGRLYEAARYRARPGTPTQS
jgi:hypothetical protein